MKDRSVYFREYNKKYRLEHPEIIKRNNNSEKHKLAVKTWKKNHPDKVREHDNKRNKRRINFKGSIRRLPINPRTGICSQCGFIGETDLHHTEYDPNSILSNTIELCKSCHAKISARSKIRDKLGRFIRVEH